MIDVTHLLKYVGRKSSFRAFSFFACLNNTRRTLRSRNSFFFFPPLLNCKNRIQKTNNVNISFYVLSDITCS